MKSDVRFEILVTVGAKEQRFALGTDAVRAVVGALDGDDEAYAGLFAAASTHPAASVRIEAAGKARLPADAALDLANDRSPDVRRAVAESPMLRRFAKPQLVEQMIASDPRIAGSIASWFAAWENVSADHITALLAADADPEVRLWLAGNSSTPAAVLRRLAGDSAPDVAKAAVATLAQR